MTFLRYFFDPVAKESLEYFEALLAMGFTVRPIPIGPIDLFIPPWNVHSNSFLEAVPETFINVVCGDADKIIRHYGPTAHINIGILLDNKTTSEQEAALNGYDAILRADLAHPQSAAFRRDILDHACTSFM